MNNRAFPAIVFVVRGRLYAFEQRGGATLLPWLQRLTTPSSVPNLPDWCLGLLNVRGTVQMVIDLAHVLGYGRTDTTDHCRLIFIEHGGAQLGLVVDSEIGVRYLHPNTMQEDTVEEVFATATALLDNRVVILLDGVAIIREIAQQLRAPAYVH